MSTDWLQEFTAAQHIDHPTLQRLSLHVERATGHVVVHEIVVKKGARSLGTGTAVMTALVAEADRHGCTLVGTAQKGLGGTSVARLQKFYSRFGFVLNRGRRRADFITVHTMIRKPEKPADGVIEMWSGGIHGENCECTPPRRDHERR